MHLLDTNACITHLRGTNSSSLSARLKASPAGSVALCSVVVAELLFGAYRSNRVAQTLAQVRAFCAGFPSLPFDDAAAAEYGQLRAHLTAHGIAIGPNDIMIASIALANDMVLVSHNTSEFGRVPRLKMEDWQSP